VTGLLLLVPVQSTTALAIEIVVFGLLAGRVLLALGSEAVKDEPRSIVLVDRLSPRVVITAALIASGGRRQRLDGSGTPIDPSRFRPPQSRLPLSRFRPSNSRERYGDVPVVRMSEEGRLP
jgi:hypothetical protein